MNLEEFNIHINKITDGIKNQGPIKMMGTEEGTKHIPVEIELSEPSLGPISTTGVVGCSLGFDWNAGKFIIYPEEKLVRINYKNQQTTKMRKDSAFYCKSCMTNVKESDRYCNSCGKKFE